MGGATIKKYLIGRIHIKTFVKFVEAQNILLYIILMKTAKIMRQKI